MPPRSTLSLSRGLLPAALLVVLLRSSAAVADPVLFSTMVESGGVGAGDTVRVSTSGHLDTTWGHRDLLGVTDAAVVGLDEFEGVGLGSISIGDRQEGPWAGTFRVQFRFDNGLPPIDVSGGIGWLGYNPREHVAGPKVTTPATAEQVALYPPLFQRMISDPDRIRTQSFADESRPTMELRLYAYPQSPGSPVPTPEPSTLLIFAATLASLGWRARRGRVSARSAPSIPAPGLDVNV